jgi:uridine kinase
VIVRSQLDDLVGRVAALDQPRVVIAISGFGGAGKSTLAGTLKPRLEPAAVVAADDFWINRALGRSPDWASLDRNRLRTQVLEPFRQSGVVQYQIYDWLENRPLQWRSHSDARRLIVEGVGIIHPDLTTLFDYIIWIDCPPAIALERAIRRNRVKGADDQNEDLWRTTWGPNDADFFATYHPHTLADFVYCVDV